ncbi:MAG: hypothetical protein K8F91_22430, partial [Candidatus Obscuribacterales bacterium]|nr:hypothetical protein [Candidatus Obscuribacterales bacterium]
MNRIAKPLLLSGVAIILMMVTMAWQNRSNQAGEWPEFLGSTEAGKQPQYNYEVTPDFGWRTGNLVPLTLYFKCPATVDLLAWQIGIEGDFNLVNSQVFTKQEGENTLTKVNLTLQAFTYKPAWQVDVSVPYRRDAGEIAQLKLAPIEVSTSKTYDDKKSQHPKEPFAEPIHKGHLLATMAWLASGSFGMVFAVGRIFRRKTNAQVTETETAETPWQSIRRQWQLIEAGKQESAKIKAFAEAVSKYFGIENQTASELASGQLADKEHLSTVTAFLEKALFTE